MAQLHLAWFVRVVCTLLLVLLGAFSKSLGAESTPLPPVASQIEQTNSQEVIRAYLQLQDQLQATQLGIEQSRREAKAAAAQNAEALAKGLQVIEEAFAAQRARDWEAMQRSNHAMLIVAGGLAAMGFLAMLLLNYFQWRMSKGLAEISAALPTAPRLGPGPAVAALNPAAPSEALLVAPMGSPEEPTQALNQPVLPAVRSRKGIGRSIERRLFPKASDAFRRRQFRALKAALIVGLFFAAVVALLLYVVYLQRNA